MAAASNPSGGALSEVGFGAMGMAAMQQQQLVQQQLLQQQQLAAQQAAQTGQAPPAGVPAAPAAGAPMPIPDVMTPEQAAEFMQVGLPDVMAAIESGELKAKKIGTAFRISKANLEAFLGG